MNLDKYDYSEVQALLISNKQQFTDCCKYYLHSSIHTNKFKYLFKLLPKSLKIFKLIADTFPKNKNVPQNEQFIEEYFKILRTLQTEKIAFIFQFLLNNGTNYPFFLELVANFTNIYPNYSIYAILSLNSRKDELGNKNLEKSKKEIINKMQEKRTDLLENITPLIRPEIISFINSSRKLLKFFSNIKLSIKQKEKK